MWLLSCPLLLVLVCFPAEKVIRCEGTYPKHLQGICADGHGSLFWSFTDRLVKTDRTGKALEEVTVRDHHGDLCHHDGKVYVAVNFGKFNDPKGNADSWVYVYDARDLSRLARHRTPEVFHGAGGIAHHKGRFLVVGGLPKGVEENYVYEYDQAFRFRHKRVIKSGQTRMGIQTATFAKGHWWFGCYGNTLLKVTPSFELAGKYAFDCGLGVVGFADGPFLVGRGQCAKEKGCDGRAVPAVVDEKSGLRLRP